MIKRIRKILLWVLAVLLIPPVILFAVIQIPAVQTRLVNQISHFLEDKIHARIHVGSVSYHFFNQLNLNDLYLEDQHQDTLIFISKLGVDINGLSFSDNQYLFSDIQIDGLYGRFYKDTSNRFNYSFLLAALRSDSTKQASPTEIRIGDISLTNSRIRYFKQNTVRKEFGMTYSDLDFSGINLEAYGFKLKNDTISGRIDGLSVSESCGIAIQKMQSDFLVTPTSILLSEALLSTEISTIDANSIALYFTDFDDFDDFENLIRMEGNLRNSSINIQDISYFAPSLRGMTDSLTISGYFNGTIPYLNTRYISLQYGQHSGFEGDIQFIGLPDADNCFIHADINKLYLQADDILSLHLPDYAQDEFPQLPDLLKQMGYLRYEGYYTGLFTDFVAYGTLSSYVGELSTDIKFKEDDEAGQILYSGEIEARNFELGEILQEENWLGRVDLSMKVDGYQRGKLIKTTLDGSIREIEINKYPLKNITISGLYEDELFDGFLTVRDENLDMQFTGSVNFRNEIPKFSFSSVIDTANLLVFGLNLPDSIASVKFDMLSNFKGDNLDNFEGEIFVWDLEFARNNSTFIVDDIAVKAERGMNKARLDVQSSALDLEVDGNYTFADLPDLLLNFVNNYLPSLRLTNKNVTYNQDFSFDLKLKNSDAIFQTLVPGLLVSNGTTASGTFNSAESVIDCKLHIPELQVYGTESSNINSHIQSAATELSIALTTNEINFSDGILLQNITLKSESLNDSSHFDLGWNNEHEDLYSGQISATLTIPQAPGSIADLSLHPSAIIISDSIWNLEPCRIRYNKEGIQIDDFRFSHAAQVISVDGKYSFEKADTLQAGFNQIDLALLNPFTREYDFTTNGSLSGSASIISGYKNPLFFANLLVDEFGMNDKSFGDARFETNWNEEDKSLVVSGEIDKLNLVPVLLEGEYSPGSGNLNFIFTLDKFNLALLEPFAADLVSNVAGVASNKLFVSGTLNEPVITGQLKIQKAAFTVDYLQTTYYFSDVVRFSRDSIIAPSITLNDQQNNTAVVSGNVTHKNFSAFNLDFLLKTNNLQFLNTEVIDNTDYYGKAYAGGTVKIYGPLDAIVMDINAKTNAGTKFYIPLYTETSLTSNSFITFVKPPSDKDSSEQAPVAELVSEGGIILNFNLEVTPDAEVQLIFDDKIGDIIKGNGKSNLKMEINTAGDFNMFGDFEITNGEYLFTLANFFSRKFKIKEGGIIRWTGDPYEASTDLTAYYNVSAPLKDLLSDTTNDVYQKKLNIECLIGMQGALLEPAFDFSIKLPGEAGNQQALLDNLPENELNKQFISLLVINQFQPLTGSGSLLATVGSGTSTISQSASEILSNQLSHWVSQISNDFDIGFKYRPGDQISSDEVELALKTTLFNDYLIINGNFGYGGQYANANTMVGDVEAEVKVTKNGKIKVKAFNKSNTNLDYEKGPYTRGVGLFFREEFNSLEELLNRYFTKPEKIQSPDKGR